MSTERIYSDLIAARRKHALTIMQETRSAAAGLARHLNEQLARGHDSTAFIIALLLAAAKDGLDIFGDIILLATGGTGSSIWILLKSNSVFLSFSLAYFLWGKGWFNKTKIRALYSVLGLVFDNLPAFDALPLNVLLVLWAWHIVRSRATDAKRDLRELRNDYRSTDFESDYASMDYE